MSTPAPTWRHPVLGEFTRDLGCWTGEIALPSFAKFDLPFPKGRYLLEIASGFDETPAPPGELVEVAEKLVASEAELVGVITLAIWRELTGEGPDSGMWWHGGIPAGEISQLMGPNTPEGPEDLVDWLELKGVECMHYMEDEKPIAEFGFSAPWEEEHGGMAVLVEDGAVNGFGYGCEAVMRFGYKPDKKKLTINPFTGEPIE